jgi:2-C-methyl-D-erythritol 4-phosphate cytidylyltransferase / 2-C-methyl-D-erythritol 2,4-cyclodiphosphate synthase
MSDEGTAVVVVAAGASRRFGEDKLAVELGGRPVLDRAVHALRAALPAAPVALVVRPEQVREAAERWSGQAVAVVAGGERRQDSVRNGVSALALADDTVVLIHDGARPFVPAADVLAVAEAARSQGAALLVSPIADTVKRVLAHGQVAETVSREGLARALTPQAFRAGVLRDAWARAAGGVWTDEAALVESVGGAVRAVVGDPRNVKVTRREDLAMVTPLFAAQMRVGQGIDIHPFAPGRELWLAGVEIAGETGLAGHSDADVVLHAVTDAILGACGAGDIGEHFPPSDERWRGAASQLFVRRALELAGERGLAVASCDVTVLAERPRIGPHRERMRSRLAEILSVDRERVNVKATTCEGLGFVGRGEGIVATAVVALGSR